MAQRAVIGREMSGLQERLEKPDLDKSKAFEALVELSVTLRLLSHSDIKHDFVPRNRFVTNQSCFDATDVLFVGATNADIASLLNAVERHFSQTGMEKVLQTVAVPLCAVFPKYDFFLLHRRPPRLRGKWKIKVGFQCKMTREYPDEKHAAEAKSIVPISVWVEGSPPETRDMSESHGWKMMTKQDVRSFLGESIFHCLP